MPLDTLQTIAGSQFINAFPGLHAANCDSIDDHAGPCLTSDGLIAINTELLCSGPNPTLGAGGFSVAKYYQIFDQVFMWGQFRFGTSGISAGGGVYVIQLPFSLTSLIPPTTNMAAAPVIGTGSTYDANANAGRLPLTVHLRAANHLMFGVRFSSGAANRELRDTGTLTWDVNDGITWNLRAKRA